MCEISCKNSKRLLRKWQKNFRGYFFAAHCESSWLSWCITDRRKLHQNAPIHIFQDHKPGCLSIWWQTTIHRFDNTLLQLKFTAVARPALVYGSRSRCTSSQSDTARNIIALYSCINTTALITAQIRQRESTTGVLIGYPLIDSACMPRSLSTHPSILIRLSSHSAAESNVVPRHLHARRTVPPVTSASLVNPLPKQRPGRVVNLDHVGVRCFPSEHKAMGALPPPWAYSRSAKHRFFATHSVVVVRTSVCPYVELIRWLARCMPACR